MEIQNNNLNWANQVNTKNFHISLSSQAGEEYNNQVSANINSNSLTTCIDLANTTFPYHNINRLSPPALSYKELQLANNNLWDGRTQPIFLFGRLETQEMDVNNIKVSLERISNFITNCNLKNHKEDEIPYLAEFSKVAFKLILSIFKGGWNNLLTEDGQKMFCDKIKEEFTMCVLIVSTNRRPNCFPSTKLVELTNISSF